MRSLVFTMDSYSEIVELDTGAIIFFVTVGAISPLYYVSLLDLCELVLTLLAADENARCSGHRLTCLAAAAFFDRTKTVRLLLDKGAKVSSTAPTWPRQTTTLSLTPFSLRMLFR